MDRQLAAVPRYQLDLWEAVGRAFGVRVRRAGRLSSRVWRLESDRGPLAFKLTRLDEAELAFVHALQEHAAASGFPLLTRFLTARDGRPAAAYWGLRAVLSPWLPGRAADLAAPADLDAVLAALATFHQATGGFEPPPAAPPGRLIRGWWRERLAGRQADLERFASLAASPPDPALEPAGRLYTEAAPAALEDAGLALSLLETLGPALSSGGATGSACHHDLAPGNLLVTETGSVGLLDLDHAVVDSPWHDVAQLLGRLLRTAGWDPDRATATLDRYRRFACREPGAEAAVLPLLAWPNDVWQLGVQWFVEGRSVPVPRGRQLVHRYLRERPARWRLIRALAHRARVACP